jgi:nicotinamidase-related amidase
MTRALVVIDMLVDFVRQDGALYCGPTMAEILPVVAKEISRARAADEPVVYLTDAHLPDDAEFAMFPPHAIRDTPGAAVVPEVAPRPGDVVVRKRRYSGFHGTDLDVTLRELKVDTIRIVGVCTNICVLYTAADARNLGYDVEIVSDGVTTFDAEAHRFALRELDRTLRARIVTSA